MQLELPSGAAAILEILEQQGAQARVVGGCVRDSLRGVCPNDWDICTDMLPQAVAACLRGQGLSVIETGLQHGTVTALWQGEPFEITTYRVDGAYTDARHPAQVTFVDSLQADLARRDFTVNAMAYHPRDGLCDPFGGQQDLAAGVIRCVGNPCDRFAEDALRILRALRFAATLGFALEPATAAAVHDQRALLTHIAAERIQAELVRLLCSDGAAAVLTDYPDVLGVFLPELLPMMGFAQHNPHHRYDVWQHTVHTVAAAPPNRVLRLAALLHDIGKPSCYSCDAAGVGHFYAHGQASTELAATILRRLKFDNDTTARVKRLVQYHDAELRAEQRLVKRWLNRLGELGLRDLLALKRADVAGQGMEVAERLTLLVAVECCIDTVVAEQQCFCQRDLAVNGCDLLSAGIPEGAAVGQTLHMLLELVLQEELPNVRQTLLAVAVDIYRQNS